MPVVKPYRTRKGFVRGYGRKPSRRAAGIGGFAKFIKAPKKRSQGGMSGMSAGMAGM